MIAGRPWWQRALARKLYRLSMRLENNGLADFERNGERRFVRDLLDFYSRSGHSLIRVLDVGANEGAYSDVVLAEAASRNLAVQIHAFEPMAAAHEKLTARLGGRQGVHLIRAAASDRAGDAWLHYDRAGSSLASLHARSGQELQEPVRLLRLDDYLAQAELDHLELVKLDVEGHELAALAGLGRFLDAERIDFIQFEYGGTSLDARTCLLDCYRLLEGAGFRIAKVMPRGLEPRRYDVIMENFQYANYVAYAPRLEAKLD